MHPERARPRSGGAAGRAPRVHARGRRFHPIDVEIAELRYRLQVARTEKYRHDLLNAFTAIEGATRLLAEETLSEADRSTLAEKFGSGLRRLRVLLATGPEDARSVLAQVASSVANDVPWRGRVQVDVDDDLVVDGSPGEMAEALRQLLTYSSRRVPGGVITVRALRKNDRIELWVDDCGPQLTTREVRAVRQTDRARPFGRDGTDALQVAARLVRGQGGDLLVDTRPDGTSLGMCWPDAVD